VLGAIAAIELAENAPASERALHLECRAPLGAAARAALVRALPAAGVTGLSVGRAAAPRGASRRGIELWGSAYVTDILPVPGSTALHLRRHVQAFCQANRYLIAELLDVVLSSVDGERMLDLYAGVGLLALALAAAGRGEVVAVEADPTNVADLRVNARPSSDRVKVVSGSVEAYLGGSPEPCADTVIVDPPRTGMSRDAMAGVVKIGCRRVVYVSCDVATLARDIRRLVDAGYHLDQVQALDLFPNTPHVEVVAVLTRA
jgi:tRNA/tmRNA/rRNA uracil-C5-methylase (TrmA/RlmC/RlmD family)